LDQVGRDDPIAPTNPYDAILSTACHFQNIGKWNLALLLVMPDHLHLIANIVSGAMGSSRPTGLERVIRDFKRSVSRLFGIRFQRDFFDTRLRDDAHFAEKYNYILGNPVRKGLCSTQAEWPYSIAFSREGVAVGRDDPIAPDEFKKVLPTKAQLAKHVFAAELMFGLVARASPFSPRQ
jgi:REP element-mobilizing transposase RayT